MTAVPAGPRRGGWRPTLAPLWLHPSAMPTQTRRGMCYSQATGGRTMHRVQCELAGGEEGSLRKRTLMSM